MGGALTEGRATRWIADAALGVNGHASARPSNVWGLGGGRLKSDRPDTETKAETALPSMISAIELLALCEQARREGGDFPAIWSTILQPHPLVIGMPQHEIEDGETLIVVALLSGETLVSSARGFRLK
jgi:hypothetical protein